MPSNGTSATAEAAGPTLADLDHTELTVALGASDMPARVRDVPPGQLAVWAQQGLDRLGGQTVRERAERTRYLEYGERGIGTATPEESAELRGMWPSVRRLDVSHDRAYDLRAQLAADIRGVPEGEVPSSGRPATAEAERRVEIASVVSTRQHFAQQAEKAREAGDAGSAWSGQAIADYLGERLEQLRAHESGRAVLAKATAELSAADTQAERRAAAAEIRSNPEATPDELAWARNWEPEAQAAEAGTAEMGPEAAI